MTPDQLQARFSKRLRCLRRKNGLTQRALAEATGIAQNQIAFYETERHMPSAYGLYLLAKAFDCSVDVVLGLTNTIKKC